MKKHLFVLSIIVLMLFGFSSTSMGSERDQGQIFGTGGDLELETDEWSQSITTGISGQLTEIEIQFHYGVPTQPPALSLSIFEGGNPISGTALFSQQLSISSADLGADNVFTWDLRSADLIFNAGDVFSLVLQADGTGYNIAGNDPPGYTGGELFKNGMVNTELSDIAFITYVDSVPGPIHNPENGHYYQLVEFQGSGLSWYDAKDAAEAMEYKNMKGHLATLTSPEEEKLVLDSFPKIVPNYVWLGATDEHKEDEWKWITGETWSYTNWDSGEPNGGIYENCLDYSDGIDKWNDESCERPLKFFLVEYSLPLINDLVTFEPDPSTYEFIPDTEGCQAGAVGKFTFDAKLTNISQKNLSNLFVEVDELTNNNLLLTSNGLVGEGARFPITRIDRIEALIDGRSQLILQDNTAQWYHLDFAAPGRHEFRNDPTIINGVEWFPVWPDIPDEENRFCNCYSDVFTSLYPPFPSDDFNVELKPVRSRSETRIIQEPTSENDYTLIIEFDDNAPGGSDSYIVEVLLEHEIDGDYSNGALSPGEYVDVPFSVCLQDKKPFRFFVNVLGVTKDVDLEKGLVAYFPFNGNANDESGNGNDGTVNGATLTTDRFGKVNSAYSFDGVDDWIEVPNSMSLNFGTNDFTVNLWVNYNTTDEEQVIIEKWIQRSGSIGDPSLGWTLTKLAENLIRFAAQPPNDFEFDLDVDPSTIQIGKWNFITLMRLGNTFKIYWDGILLGSDSKNVNLDSTSSLKLGRRCSSDNTPGCEDDRGFFIDGFLDDVRIYKRALSEAEISALYNLNE